MAAIVDWPKPLPDCAIGRYVPNREINLSRLDPEEKARTWAELRRERPALAALLRDPNLQALVATAFNADICIEIGEQP